MNTDLSKLDPFNVDVMKYLIEEDKKESINQLNNKQYEQRSPSNVLSK